MSVSESNLTFDVSTAFIVTGTPAVIPDSAVALTYTVCSAAFIPTLSIPD